MVSVQEKSCPGYYEFLARSFVISSGLFPFYCGQSGWELFYSLMVRMRSKRRTNSKLRLKNSTGYCCFHSPGLTSTPIVSKMLCVRQLRSLSWMPNEMGIWEQRIDSLDKS